MEIEDPAKLNWLQGQVSLQGPHRPFAVLLWVCLKMWIPFKFSRNCWFWSWLETTSSGGWHWDNNLTTLQKEPEIPITCNQQQRPFRINYCRGPKNSYRCPPLQFLGALWGSLILRCHIQTCLLLAPCNIMSWVPLLNPDKPTNIYRHYLGVVLWTHFNHVRLLGHPFNSIPPVCWNHVKPSFNLGGGHQPQWYS